MTSRNPIRVLCVAVCCTVLWSLASSVTAQERAAPLEDMVSIGIDQGVQPFALPETDSGLTVEILRASFLEQNQKSRFAFLPQARVMSEYRAGNIDVILSAKPDATDGLVLTHWPVQTFRNMAITRKARRLPVAAIADLAPLRICAFQSASECLGAEFKKTAKDAASYTELAFISPTMLMLDRVDVIVSQADVFRYNLIKQSIASGVKLDQSDFEFHDLFGTGNQYWYGFRTEKMRDQFERGLETIYANGVIDEIFSRYARNFAASRSMFVTVDDMFAKHK